MNPNDVDEFLRSSVTEFELPVTLFNGGPLLISTDDSTVSREDIVGIVQQWMELDKGKNDEIPQEVQEWLARVKESYGLHRNHRNHRISTGKTIPEIYEEVERLALDTERIPEVREILKSLIAEQELPIAIFHRGFEIIILADDGTHYRNDEMLELEALLKKEGLDVRVRHSGFRLTRTETGSSDIQFLKIQEIAILLQSMVEKYGLRVKLLHEGFKLEKDQENRINIAEVKEIALRLTLMTGIDFSAGGYGMGPKKDVKQGWTSEINWNSVTLFIRSYY